MKAKKRRSSHIPPRAARVQQCRSPTASTAEIWAPSGVFGGGRGAVSSNTMRPPGGVHTRGHAPSAVRDSGALETGERAHDAYGHSVFWEEVSFDNLRPPGGDADRGDPAAVRDRHALKTGERAHDACGPSVSQRAVASGS